MPSFRIATLHDIHAICRFLTVRLSAKDLTAWTSDVPAHVFWYIKSSLCALSEDCAGVSAVVMGRPVARVEDGASDSYLTDWKGAVLWVECIVSREGMANVWREAIAFLKSHGCQFTKVAWCRMKRGAKPFVFDFETLNGRFA